MENFLSRYRNLICLAALLMGQLIGLAVQVRTDTPQGSVSLFRTWTIAVVTPFEKLLVHAQTGVRNVWTGYFYLRGVRKENRQLKDQIEQMRLEQIRIQQDALQAKRLQTLLGFKEQYVSQTIAAQVIGTSGSEQSRLLYIDKGANAGIRNDMAVIAPGGIVGKILRVSDSSAQVLMINDQLSGVGAILQNSRLQGIVSGDPRGALILKYIMKDEKIQPGEPIITSGGDHVFPKGMLIGTVAEVSSDTHDLFLGIRLKPAVSLNSVEEVLVVTQIVERGPTLEETGGPVRAADILAQRLPGLPSPTPTPTPGTGTANPAAAAGQQGQPKPAAQTSPTPARAAASPSPRASVSGAKPASGAAASAAVPAGTVAQTPPRAKTSSTPAKPSSTPASGTGVAPVPARPRPSPTPQGSVTR